MEWYILAILSALLSSFAAIVEKKSLFYRSAFSFSLIVSILNVFIAAPFLFFVDYSFVSGINLGILFFKSLLGAGAFFCVMKGLKDLEISKALPLLVLTPGVVAVLAWIVLGESLNTIEVLGIFFLMGGSYAILIRRNFLEDLKEEISSKSLKYILLALVLFSVSSILDKSLLSTFNLPINAFMGFQHLFLGIIFLLFSLFYLDFGEIKQDIRRGSSLLILVSLLTIGYRYSQILAVRDANVALVLSLKRISVLFSVLLGGIYFNDHNLLRRVLATIAMTLGAILIILG